MKKIIFRWAKVVVLLYGVIGIALYYLQDKVLLHPVAVKKDAVWSFRQPYTELNLTYDKETNLNIIQFRTDSAKGPAKGVVLYFHGNAGNNGLCEDMAAAFTANGYECWVLDYPGFGKSTGRFTEENLYRYALIFYKLARSKWPTNQIIIAGRSLGTGVAAELAAQRDCRRLILLSPYYSMTSLVRRYAPIYPVGQMIHYHFPTNEYLKDVTAPITIFHGEDDKQIPIGNAARLKPLLKPGDEFITVPGAGHQDLTDSPAYKEKLESILRQ